MLFQKGRGPYGPLGDGVALDTSDADPNGHAHLLIHLDLKVSAIFPDGHLT
jgi:hypothetical protein